MISFNITQLFDISNRIVHKQVGKEFKYAAISRSVHGSSSFDFNDITYSWNLQLANLNCVLMP